ncbi:MAG: hypothetical protein QOJ29_4349 [Thermoleophilaceae bacterium]|nr:hypothetical protein [Thermoleophilaceae bacterium]
MGTADWHEAVLDAERRGELLTAFDLAERGLSEEPNDLWLKHRAVLALARAGSTGEAARRFRDYGLAGVEHEDVAALEARIAKDEALAAGSGFGPAAALYESIFRNTGGYYPAVNAATLRLLGGETERARTLAREAATALVASGDDSYYCVATEAEIALVLGDTEAAAEALARAGAMHGGDFSALATTRRQLRLLVDATGADPVLLDALAGPTVAHFCGHRIAAPDKAGRFPAGAEHQVAHGIAEAIDADPPGFAYGALASGGDILCAEALLAAGAELHVVLPFARDEFVQTSVADAGHEWVRRFDVCMAAAASVSYATEDAFLGDDVLYRYGSELAMGMALQRAGWLDSAARQIAVWDGGPAAGAAGTAIDVETWSRTGKPVTVVPPDAAPKPVVAAPATAGPGRSPTGARVLRALLFADVKGFSKLTDEQLPRFAAYVMGAFGDVLERHSAHVEYRNTWGDALYVVMSEPEHAAVCAHDLQSALAEVDLAAAGLPPHLALRLGAHIGPVFPIRDPIAGERAFIGSHVSRTARIEPVTPPGAVYVTDAFAAALALRGSEYACDYVGHMPAAKDYGRLRMYRLRAPA